jgi:hypothetical protein
MKYVSNGLESRLPLPADLSSRANEISKASDVGGKRFNTYFHYPEYSGHVEFTTILLVKL